MITNDWPFADDADRDDPLTKLRIAVTSSHPRWCYLVTFDRESLARPTDEEAAMLASYLEEYKAYWYGDSWYAAKLAERPLDVDSGANGVIFRKYATDDWGYRRRSWTRGPLYVPQSPGIRERYPDEAPLGPMSLVRVMDHAHSIVGEVDDRWLKWKATHPEVFGP
ncbi:hypothetical protein ACIGMX_34795 [Streptomyces aquilus]|uniref:hypothetical protein n=1 Tax=Streptomyces aquilus TaxID=2548456 RepID=UPI0037CF7B22